LSGAAKYPAGARPSKCIITQRVFKAEEAIAGINCDVADFLPGMNPDPADPVIICVNTGKSMKRNEQAVGGQLWMQGDRLISATNVPLEGMTNGSTSAVLTAVVEAVEWRHATEFVSDGSKRPGERVVIYPPELDRLGTVLTSKSTNCDLSEGHKIACERILSASDSFEHPPKFFPSDHKNFEGLADPPKVAEWMNLSSQIATAGRRQVAEDGPD
jgi:hypothetical protein